nr:hypothetical protein JVH1_1111 [Rhodococcus sp. JVH1]
MTAALPQEFNAVNEHGPHSPSTTCVHLDACSRLLKLTG